jgi:hypothetical protein
MEHLVALESMDVSLAGPMLFSLSFEKDDCWRTFLRKLFWSDTSGADLTRVDSALPKHQTRMHAEA